MAATEAVELHVCHAGVADGDDLARRAKRVTQLLEVTV